MTNGFGEFATSPTQTRKMLVLTIGFSLHNAWVCASMYSTQTLFGTSFVIPGVRGGNVAMLYLASILAYCLVAFLAAAFDTRLIRYSRSRPVMVAAAAATCLGTLIAPASALLPGSSLGLECLSGIVTGIGSAVLILFWGIAYARERTWAIAVCGSTAVVCGFALNAMVLPAIPSPFGGIVCALLPLGELAALNAISPRTGASPANTFNCLPTSKLRLGMTLFAPMAFVGFALGIHKHVSVQTTLNGAGGPESLVILVLAGTLTISVFALYQRLFPRGSWDTLLRVIVPLVACISLIASILVIRENVLSDLFLLITYIFIESLLWVYYAYIAHKMRLSPIFIVGVSRGIITLFMAVGALGTMYFSPYLDETPVGDLSALLISLVLIALGYALMPRESTVLASIVECPAVRLVTLELEENLGLFPAVVAPAAGAGAEQGRAEEGVESNPAPAASQAARPGAEPRDGAVRGDGAGDPTTPATPVPAADDPEAAASSAAVPMSEAAPTASATPAAPAARAGQPSAARQAMERPAAEAGGGEGRFSRKVKKVAQLYLLTERETDILFELAKGGGTAYIQEKYYISASTVKTHIRNIYRKLDIHKRSDLLRLLEEIDDYE